MSYKWLFFLLLLAGCAGTGYLKDAYPESFYKITNRLDEASVRQGEVRFLVTGDTQRGWRLKEKFLRKENWKTRKMALVPFYQLYLLGNGLWGSLRYLTHRPAYHPAFRKHMREVLHRKAMESKANFLLLLGDICASEGIRPQHWACFLQENRGENTLLDDIPLLTVPGNHDRTANPLGKSNYEAVFNRPPFYTIEFGNAVLICLDSNLLVDQKGDIDDREQNRLFQKWFVANPGDSLSWLEQQLQRYRDKQFKIVAMHHPLVSFGRHFSDWYRWDYGQHLHHKRVRLVNMLAREGVDILFAGHEHFYEHNLIARPPTASKRDGGMHVIISSSGGVPLRAETAPEDIHKMEETIKEDGLLVSNLMQRSVYHYTQVDITRDSILVRTFNTPRHQHGEVSLLEEIVIAH